MSTKFHQIKPKEPPRPQQHGSPLTQMTPTQQRTKTVPIGMSVRLAS